MKCRIKRENNDSYFNKNIDAFNHWTMKSEAKIFESIAEARNAIKKFNLKKITIERIYV